MKNYRILTNKKVDDLAAEVEIAINDGWEIAGRVFMYKSDFGLMFNQPIIKTTTDRPLVSSDCHVENCNEPAIRETKYCHFHQGIGVVD